MAQHESTEDSKLDGGSSAGTTLDSSKAFPLLVGAVLVVGLALVAFAVTRGGDDAATNAGGASETENASDPAVEGDPAPATDETDPAASGEQTAPVELTGDAIPPMPEGVTVSDATTDPAAGTEAPTLVGTSFDGEEVTIGPDGTAKAIYFVAHWCPHCQEEIPVVQQLLDDGLKPDGLEVYAVSTAVESGQGNFPPEAWLQEEGFQPTTIRDDETSAAFAGFGGTGFPYVVYLDAENRIVARSSGNLDGPTTEQLWQTAAG